MKCLVTFDQNIHNYWHLGSLDVKKKIQKLVFPEGITIDTINRTNLTSNVNSFFLAKSQFMRTSEDINEKLPIKNDEESSKEKEKGLFHDPFVGCFTKKKPCILLQRDFLVIRKLSFIVTPLCEAERGWG